MDDQHHHQLATVNQSSSPPTVSATLKYVVELLDINMEHLTLLILAVHRENNINGAYVDGVSITCGSPRMHIWTFMAALHENYFYENGKDECPCAPNSPVVIPAFIGNCYFCESGCPGKWEYNVLYTDPLWDGQQCGLIEKKCCLAPRIPWFYKKLKSPKSDYIELRVCADQDQSNEDSPVSYYEIYVK